VIDVSGSCCCYKKPEFTDKKVMAGKEYEYRVTAENAGGESEPSEVSNPIKAKPLKGLSLAIRILFFARHSRVTTILLLLSGLLKCDEFAIYYHHYCCCCC